MESAKRHVVVFDVNVYLDVATITGPAFSWYSFNAAAAAVAKVAVPHPDGAYDSLRAIAVCLSGKFAGPESVEVFSSDHIEEMVYQKAQHPVSPEPGSDHNGLGWSESHAAGLLRDLVWQVVDRSNGDCSPCECPDGNPPLDHEDGMVFGACRHLARTDPLATVYCVTRDGGFLRAAKAGKLGDHTKVLHPSQFVALVRAARKSFSIGQMKPQAKVTPP